MTLTINKVLKDLADLDLSVVTKTGDYTITENDTHINVNASSGAITITLPVTSTMSGQKQFYIKKIDSSANAVTISGVQ